MSLYAIKLVEKLAMKMDHIELTLQVYLFVHGALCLDFEFRIH